MVVVVTEQGNKCMNANNKIIYAERYHCKIGGDLS